MEERERIRKEQEDLFKELVQLNVNDRTEVKSQSGVELKYLSWAWAWQEFKMKCPDATYEIKKFKNDITGETRPYLEDETLGFMVFTSVTANGITHEMWLPVMDGQNKSMKREPYTYMTKKNGEKSVEACSMFDVNKAIMRCLTKNLAMFGLGLYIYAGEDLPEEIKEPDPLITAEQIARIRELEIIEPNVCKKFKINSIEELTQAQAEFVIKTKENALQKEKEEEKKSPKATKGAK